MARKTFFAIAMAMAFLLIGWKAAWFVAQDGCLDAGGRWSNGTCVGVEAYVPPEPPFEQTGVVTDRANLIDAADEAKLADRLKRHNAMSRHPISVVTTPSLDGQDIGTFTDGLAQSWRFGQGDRGVMILVAPNERSTRISVADGTLNLLTDDRSQVIIQSLMIPAFRGERYYSGLDTGVTAVIEAIEGRATPSSVP